MKIDPGEMDQRIVIEREVSTADGSGGSTRAWTAVHGPMWAKVRPMSGREIERSQQVQAEAGYMVMLRNREISEGDRLRWVSYGNRILNIRYVARSPRDLYIRIEAELGVEQ